MEKSIQAYNNSQLPEDKKICDLLASAINSELKVAESKIWHAHPVWFINENPIVGYSKQKSGLRLMFWSGIDFEEEGLNVHGEKFKDASVFYTSIEQINLKVMKGEFMNINNLNLRKNCVTKIFTRWLKIKRVFHEKNKIICFH